MTRFAEMDVDIDESWRNNHPTRVEVLIGLAAELPRGGDFGYVAVFEQKIVRAIQLLRRIDETTATNCETLCHELVVDRVIG